MADETLDKIKSLINGDDSNIKQEYNVAATGLNLDQTVNQVSKGQLTYALNAAVENFDASSVNYQNEPGNELCMEFPEGYHLIGTHFIQEKNKHIFFMANPSTGESEIGYMDNNDCVYRVYINANCLNFNINYPIHKSVHKITNCSTEIYWTDGLNSKRFLDLDNLPYKVKPGTDVCDNQTINEIDCNKLKIQPNYTIPNITVADIVNGGNLTAGAYQFAIQYCDAQGNGYTSYYSVTNPTPIANPQLTTPNFDYSVGRSIILNIDNIDTTGYFQHVNVAVIKTINNATSVQLIGTYFIDSSTKNITYTGQATINLTINDIFEKFAYYDVAQDVTAVQDLIVWDNLTSNERVNYQKIANSINLQWQTYKMPANENYADEMNAANLRGYMRDEVYAFEIVFLLRNGQQTDGFHIPGRVLSPAEKILPDIPETDPDFVGAPTYTSGGVGYSPYWKIYNTATVLGPASGDNINNATPHEYGEFAYWESTDVYPCNTEVWGDLANQPIRHHKFPDVRVSPIFESKTPIIGFDGRYANLEMGEESVFPIGVKFDVSQVATQIATSNLTDEQKANIAGFKIVRGDRSSNKSIVAKGILRNVGKYTREENEFYFPNYPYNDLRTDPFLLVNSNSYTVNTADSGNNNTCRNFTVTVTELDANGGPFTIQYVDCTTNVIVTRTSTTIGEQLNICCLDFPAPTIILGKGCIVCNTYKTYRITSLGSSFEVYKPAYTCDTSSAPPSGYSSWCDYCSKVPADLCCTGPVNPTVFSVGFFGSTVRTIDSISYPEFTGYGTTDFVIEEIASVGFDLCNPGPLEAFTTDESKYRHVFNSPETSFGTPFLGTVLKLENVMFGANSAHFVKVKNHSMYKLISKEAQEDALKSSAEIASIVPPGDATALFAAYQAYLTIYINGITRRNYTYSFNSIGSYDYWSNVDNGLGIKQRELDIAQYLIPGVQNVGDIRNINNFQRETSIYLKTIENREGTSIIPLPYPNETPSIKPSTISLVSDNSRFTISEVGNCNTPEKEVKRDLVAYYASLKNVLPNQYGQIYSYQTIETGYQRDFDNLSTSVVTVFGGDTFINRFSFKTKLPFFIDNRVGAPDDSDIFYDEIGNVAYPKYWYSARPVLSNAVAIGINLTNFISFKAHNFDCPNSQGTADQAVPAPGRTYYDGKMYLFAYGIPTFYCESSVNVDLRQAFNNREGDFFPHVSTGIPDDWFQQTNVPIALDNTYYYNTAYSKQNEENFISHLPVNWDGNQCYTTYPFRAIYSERQQSFIDNTVNSWLIYKPTSFFDFPQNYGNLVSLDGIQNRAVLARFENKSLLYNTLLTIDTSNPQAAYVGNDSLFRSAPPIDFAETDLGYVGSQHKMLLKIPQGQITIDAKRGQVFLIAGNQAQDLSAFGSGLNRFFTDHLAFEILRYFPKVPIDNHFNGIGLHGVYDSKYDRVIISKLDYIPQPNTNIKYDPVTNEFYTELAVGESFVRNVVNLTDVNYFCNKSWTLSFNMNTKSWISFHSYIPNWYIAENNFFYSGLNESCDLEAIAAEETPLPSTTTTTTTFAPPPPTTTTTTTYRDCTLAGTAALVDCTLAGTAEIIYAPPPF